MPGSTSYYLLRNKYLSRGYFPTAKITNTFVHQPKGELVDATVAVGGQTWADCTKAPCLDFDTVQFVYKNDRTASFELDGALVAVTNSISSGMIEPSTGNTVTGDGSTGWVRVPFSGVTSAITVPARTGDLQPSILVSDEVSIESIAPTDSSGDFPYILARTSIAEAEAISQWYHGASWDGAADPTDKLSCTFWQTRKRTGDHVTTANGMTNGNSNGNPDGDSPLIAIIFKSKTEKAVRILVTGDSLVQGQGSLVNGYYYYSWYQRLQDLYTDNSIKYNGARFNFINGGWGGVDTAETVLQTSDLIDTFDPALVIHSPHSPNDGTPDATIAGNQEDRADEVKALCDVNGSKYAAVFITPNNNLNSTADGYRLQVKSYCQSRYDTIDLTTAVSDGATPERYIPGFNVAGDNIHYSSEGAHELRNTFKTEFERIIGKSFIATDYDTNYDIAFWELGKGITLNSGDISAWVDTVAGYSIDQGTASYQPLQATDGAADFDGAAYQSLDMDAGGLGLLRNLAGAHCWVVFAPDAVATEWLCWLSVGTSTNNYRFTLRTLNISSNGGIQHLWRRQDADSGVGSTAATYWTATEYSIAHHKVDFTNEVQSIDLDDDTVNNSATGTSGTFSDTDSDYISFGAGSNRFDGAAYNGKIKSIHYRLPHTDADSVLETKRRQHGLYALSL